MLHLDEVRLAAGGGVLFVYIDVIGYIPGRDRVPPQHHEADPEGLLRAVQHHAQLRHAGAPWSRLWVLLFGWEWALLAIPIHLFGDRALFGNTLKPFAVPFEPVPHPAYVRLNEELVPS